MMGWAAHDESFFALGGLPRYDVPLMKDFHDAKIIF
jgi:hypothetical protein